MDVLNCDLEAVEGARLHNSHVVERHPHLLKGLQSLDVLGVGKGALMSKQCDLKGGLVRTSGTWTSFMNRVPRFSSTMPSEAAKNARMWLTKCLSPSLRFSQCA